MGENLVSSWSDGKTLPKNYIFPPDKRPGEHNVPMSKSLPVIDLSNVDGQERKKTIQKIIEASHDFGFFQVINHGVPRKLLDATREVVKELFELPIEEKSKIYSLDLSKICMLYSSNVDYEREEIHNWRDSLRLVCTPLEECIHSWPEKPPEFRKNVGKYVIKVRELGLRILELISEGLGLEPKYFANELSGWQVMSIHHYPPCPDPSLALGTRKHGDTGLVTILLQDHVPGLQVLNDGEWIGVEAIPDAFVINIGYQLQMISNGKLRSAEHRVVANKNEVRNSVALFIQPTIESIIEPAKALVNAENPAVYKSVRFADFLHTFRAAYSGHIEDVLEPYLLTT
ncbi:protein DOWNY MILDEW RESISTANCE 6-like [Amaranthus tricolor]|uniref:protein DOWNY MILDEW RESISTANCE 6-like n=1 Tax=Amaranthus tricolor TaxID=29722 RepID=UPI00258BA80D|nr:protein DOWNY MILDEW RESISTANCE 6-like [Amaranthus tricolor]